MTLSLKKRINLYKIYWIKGGPNYCFYCGKHVSRNQRSLDHLTPKSRGGTDEPENIRLADQKCNRAKADMTLVEFNRFVMTNGGIFKVKELYGNGSESRKDLICY